MTSITPVNSGRQSYKGFFYNPSIATQQCSVPLNTTMSSRPQCFTFPYKDDSRAELFHAKEKTVSHLVQIVQVHTYSNVKIVHHGFEFNWPINCQ